MKYEVLSLDSCSTEIGTGKVSDLILISLTQKYLLLKNSLIKSSI